MSCDEGGNSEPERNGPMDDAETSSHSVHSQASSPASSPRKSVVPPDRVVSRSTSSSSTASTKVNSKGVKSSPVSRPSLSKRSSRRSRRSKDPSNESDESTSKGNKTKHSNSNPSSTSSKLPEKSRSTKHHKERANAKGRSLASETKKPLMIKYIKSEVGDTDDAMPSSDDISTVDDTTGSRTANPKVRMNLRKRIKCQVATLFKPRCTSKSKSSRSQPVEPVEIKQEVDDEHHMSDSNICDSINRRPKNLPVIKKGQPKKIWGLTNDSYTGESTAESQDQGETAHNIMPATSSEISDNKSDELSETPPNVDDEDRRAELGLAIVKVETLEFMTGDSYPGESPEDIDESFCASTSNENQGVQSAVRDSNEDHSRETNVDDNLLCSEDFICDSDSYPNGELGGDSRVRQEVVDPPLENLDYTGWKNTKIIYTTDVSDLESEDECCIGETTEFRHQSPCEPALGDNEDDEVRKLEILRVIGCSSDVGVKSIKSGSEQLKPENSTEVDDSTCDSEGNSPIARVVRRYCNKTCQTDTLSAPPAGRDPKPAVCYNSDFQDEYNSYSNPEYPSTSGVGGSSGDASHKKNSKVLSKTEKTQCDPEPTDHTFVERTSSSGEPEENKKTLTVDPVIGNGSSDRSHPGTKAVTLMEGRFPKPVLGADNSQFDRRELEEDPTSSVLVPQVDWDLRIKKRRDKLRKLKHKQRKFRQKLRSVRRFSLSGNGLVARFLRGSVGFGSMGKRCSFYSATTPVGDCSYSSSLASPKTDILCGGTPSHGVVDLTKSPEVDRSRVGMKARRIFRVTPAILRRRPEVKNMMVKSKKTDPCRVPSIHRCGKPQPLLPKLVSAERPEERSTVVVHPPHCDAETCTAGGHLPPRESSRTRTDPREVSEMSLECTEELTEILSDDEGALVDVNNHLAVDGVRPLDVLGNSPVSLTSAHGLVDDVGLESQVLQQDPPVVEPTLEMGRYFLEARSHPPVVEPTCETDRDSHQHPTTEEPLFETDSQRIGKMTSIGRRTTTKREKALRESQQIIDEHAYCLKESANSSRISEGNKRYVIAERANFVSEKLITKNYPMVVKKRSVTVKVPKTPFAREIPSGDDQPMVPLSPDPSDLTSIVAPLPTPKNDSKTVHSRAYAPGYRSWDVDPLSGGICGDNTAESNVGNQEPPVSIYHPPPEIARLDLRVRKRLGLPCDNISYIIKKDGRPPFSYQTIAAMAIESDPLMAAKASDIYDFMKKHFSFYRSITSRWWKQNLRSMLCSSKIFRSDRIGNRVYFSFRKAWRLPGDPAIYEMLDEPPEKQNSDEDDTGIETDTNNDEDNSPTESNSCFPLDLLTPQVDLQETSELDPLIPICSYSDDESDGFPIIVDTTTYTGDHLPKPEEDDEYGLDMEIKGEPDDGTDCERPAEPKSVSADGKRVYACPYCPAVFDTLQGNLDHSVIHPEVMKPCPLCDFSSPDEVQLLWHVNSAHNK